MKYKRLLILACALTCILLANTAKAQNLEFGFNLGSTGTNSASDIATDYCGNFYLASGGYETYDLDPGAGVFTFPFGGYYDAFVTKYNENREFVWSYRISGNSNNNEQKSIEVDNEGNVYSAGRFSGTMQLAFGDAVLTMQSAGSNDIYVLKISPDGALIWAKRFGGTGEEYLSDMVISGNNEITLSGRFGSTVDFNPSSGTFNLTNAVGESDVFISKFDTDGNWLWAKSFVTGGSGGNLDDSYSDSENNLLFCGHFWNTVDFDPNAGVYNLTSGGFATCYVVKLTSNGDFIWAIAFGGSQPNRATGLCTDTDSNVYVAGYVQGNNADLDPGPDTYILPTTTGLKQMYVAKYSPNAEFIWAKTEQASEPSAIDFANGRVVAVGEFQNQFQYLDNNIQMFAQNSNGDYDIFILALDTEGDYQFAGALGGSGLERISDIHLDHQNLFLAGYLTSQSADVDFTASTQMIGTYGSYDCLVMKYAMNDCNLESTASSQPSICDLAMGSASIEANINDVSSVFWSDSLHQTTLTANNLVAGEYCYALVGGNGCVDYGSVVVGVTQGCAGDFDLDGVITINDAMMLVQGISSGSLCPYDIVPDNVVNIEDLTLLLQMYGSNCE